MPRLKIRIAFFFILLMCSACGLLAQYIEGVVYDGEDAQPVAYALIFLTETEEATLTDSAGVFRLRAPQLSAAHLRVEALGYETSLLLVPVSDSKVSVRLIPRHLDMHEVTVSGATSQSRAENPFHIESRKLSDLTAIAAMNMGEAIARIPGVYQSSLGNGIAKPVVRGLQGMRVVTLMNGLRIESQQWGGDHGMGISELGLGTVEVIKGPASLLYGADALAGVVYFNDAPHAAVNTRQVESSSLFQSNTLGLTQRVMYREAREKIRWQLGASYANHADFKLPTGRYAQNSRFNEVVVKSVLSLNGKRSVHHFRYTYSNATSGIPGHTHDSTATPETFQVETQRRSYTLPAQLFSNHFASFDNKWFADRSELQILAGFTSNGLVEYDEKVTIPSLSMSLSNALASAKWIWRPAGDMLKIISGAQAMHQWNINSPKASDRLVPNSTTFDRGVFTNVQWGHTGWNVQGGIRFDQRDLQETGAVQPDSAFKGTYRGWNASVGGVFHRELYTLRASLSSGFRAPHLTELLSNGFHHGALRYELGDRNLLPERATQADVTVELTGEHLVLLYNPFVNRINNFIYLQPLDYSVEGIPAFAYRSLSEVLFYGNDVGVHYHPHFAHDLHLEATWSLVKTQTPSDSSISMLPPQRLQTTLTYSFEGHSAFRVKEINFMHTWMDAQRTVAFYETPSQAYQLLDIAVALQLGRSKAWECRIGCKNVLNEQYIDHLSRLKNIEMPAPGRNIYVNILYSFKQNKKN